MFVYCFCGSVRFDCYMIARCVLWLNFIYLRGRPPHWTISGYLGPFYVLLGASLGHLGVFLGASWVILERAWGHLGQSWGHLGLILGNLGSSWTIFDRPGFTLQSSCGDLGLHTRFLKDLQCVFVVFDTRTRPRNESPRGGGKRSTGTRKSSQNVKHSQKSDHPSRF